MRRHFASHSTMIRLVSVLLCYLLLVPPAYWASTRRVDPGTPATVSGRKTRGASPNNAPRFLAVPFASQSYGIVLTPVNGSFNGHVGIGHHQPTNKLLLSAFHSSGQPHNFELVAPDATHTQFSNVAG